MAKSYLSNGEFIAAGTASSNYVQQIAAGESTFDIAVKNGIRFFNGQEDEEGILWDGVSPLEVVIPAISDIISDPIHFVGTVGANGVITYTEAGKSEPVKGDLVYITESCNFPTAGNPCEGGDMAVYDGTAWRVISGENQVEILGTPDNGVVSVALSGTARNILTVEGTTLALAVDYSNISGIMNADNEISVLNGSVTVAPLYIGLSYTAGESQDITTSMSIDLPTALADGTVTISDKVLASGDFTFTSGSFPTINKNENAIALNVSHNMSIAKSDGTGDFVTAVSAIKAISFGAGSSASNDFGFVASLSAIEGTSFVSGIHAYTDADQGKTADFSIWAQATVSNSTFISGLSDAGNSGDLVSSITVGTVSLDAAGEGILTGISTSGSDVVTDLSFGNVALDTTAQWFFNGLSSNGSQVVTDVTIGELSFVSDNSSSFAGSAITSASVSNHVLTFTTGSFMTPVSISKAADTIAKADFTKSGVKLENTSVSKGGFTSASLVQAATSVSYKSVLSGDVTLSQSSVSYFFDKAADHNYEAVMDYVTVSTTPADVTKNAATIENPTISVSIPANTVAVSLTDGTLPSLTISAPNTTISGAVGTSLAVSTVSWLAVDESKKDIAAAGTYTLVSASESAAGMIEVAEADTYAVDNATVTIVSGTYVTEISK